MTSPQTIDGRTYTLTDGDPPHWSTPTLPADKPDALKPFRVQPKALPPELVDAPTSHHAGEAYRRLHGFGFVEFVSIEPE